MAEKPTSKRSLRLLAATGVLSLVAGLAACGGGTKVSTNTPSTTVPATVPSTPTPSTPSTPAPSKSANVADAVAVGSTVDVTDLDGNTGKVTLLKIIDPASGVDEYNVADAGKRLVGAVFTITAVGGPLDDNANGDAIIVGSDNQTYEADYNDIAGYTNFSSGSYSLSVGESVTGAVTFQLPNGVKVSTVKFDPSSGYGELAGEWTTGLPSVAPTPTPAAPVTPVPTPVVPATPAPAPVAPSAVAQYESAAETLGTVLATATDTIESDPATGIAAVSKATVTFVGAMNKITWPTAPEANAAKTLVADCNTFVTDANMVAAAFNAGTVTADMATTIQSDIDDIISAGQALNSLLDVTPMVNGTEVFA